MIFNKKRNIQVMDARDFRLHKTTLWKFSWHYLKMKTIFMNTENSKTSEPHKFKLDLTDKLDLKDPNKTVSLANLSIYYT